MGEVEKVNWQKSSLPSQFRKEYVNMGTECCETDSSLAIHALACTLWKVCIGVIALQLADFTQIK